MLDDQPEVHVALVVTPDGALFRHEFTDDLDHLRALIGGGYLQAVPSQTTEDWLLCDEDGQSKELPLNPKAIHLCDQRGFEFRGPLRGQVAFVMQRRITTRYEDGYEEEDAQFISADPDLLAHADH